MFMSKDTVRTKFKPFKVPRAGNTDWSIRKTDEVARRNSCLSTVGEQSAGCFWPYNKTKRDGGRQKLYGPDEKSRSTPTTPRALKARQVTLRRFQGHNVEETIVVTGRRRRQSCSLENQTKDRPLAIEPTAASLATEGMRRTRQTRKIPKTEKGMGGSRWMTG